MLIVLTKNWAKIESIFSHYDSSMVEYMQLSLIFAAVFSCALRIHCS
jgi:hypothetical protein